MGAEHVRLHLDERLVDQAEDLGHEAVQDQTARENNRAQSKVEKSIWVTPAGVDSLRSFSGAS